MIKNVKHYILKDFKGKEGTAGLDGVSADSIFKSDPVKYNNQISFTCLLSNPDDGLLYCGLSAWTTDVMYVFDPVSKEFRSLEYDQISEPYEVKVHRSLERASDGTIWFATACLHDLDNRRKAPGGYICKIPQGTQKPEKVKLACQHEYIQTITHDDKRGLIYGETYPVHKLFVYNIATDEVEYEEVMGSISHVSTLDDEGCYWSTWGYKHKLYRYNPATKDVEFFQTRLPNAVEDSNIMYAGAGPMDVAINGGDGYLYVGTCGGSLCRINTKTAETEYLGHPAPTRRMPGLLHFKDGLLLGICGDEDGGTMFTYDLETKYIKVLGPIIDSQTGLSLYRTHDLRLGSNGLIYLGETDVPDRSGYLWEIEIEI
jgi:hypothetical protein